MKRQLLRTIPAIIWGSLILVASITSSNSVPSANIPHLDKVVHFTLYFILCILIIFATTSKQGLVPLMIIVIAVLSSGIFGIVMEYLQEVMKQGRSAELLDAVANTLGAIMAGILYRPLSKKIIDKYFNTSLQ